MPVMVDDVGEQSLLQGLRDRIVELEIRSEERRKECDALRAFVDGYEKRIQILERQLARLGEQMENPAEPLPAALEDLPPHY